VPRTRGCGAVRSRQWVWLACRDAVSWRFADVAALGGGLLVASGPDVAELTLLPLGQVAGHGMTLSRTWLSFSCGP
jgi:hypothetical protein